MLKVGDRVKRKQKHCSRWWKSLVGDKESFVVRKVNGEYFFVEGFSGTLLHRDRFDLVCTFPLTYYLCLGDANV